MNHKILIGCSCVALSIVVLLLLEVWSAYHGSRIKFTDPASTPLHFRGKGPRLLYVVMGDSTAAGRGADFEHSVAYLTASHLAASHDLTLINLGTTGARIEDILIKQLPKAKILKPDLCLISVGANDVTHLTSGEKIHTILGNILTQLVQTDKRIEIVVSGSGDVGACRRLAQPLRYIAGLETKRINYDMRITAMKFPQVTWVPLAERTGYMFEHDATLFAEDKFHPNNKGYTIWSSILLEGLQQALEKQRRTLSSTSRSTNAPLK